MFIISLRSYLVSAIILTGIFCLVDSSLAVSSQDVVISELAWMGTVVSANHEWIELHNNTGSVIDLSGWILSAQDGSPAISLSGVIASQGYFLLERTSDDSVPNITADQIYSGALSNSGEVVELKDDLGNLIDVVDASGGWPFGDNTDKRTMERISGGWQYSASAGGTPRAENSVYSTANNLPTAEAGADQEVELGETAYFDGNASIDSDGSIISFGWDFGDGSSSVIDESPTHTYLSKGVFIVTLTVTDDDGGTDSDTLELRVVSPSLEPPFEYQPSDIVVNEFVADPVSGESEWIELFNNTSGDIDLVDWVIKDGTFTQTPLSGVISAYGFIVIEKLRSQLNNSGDIITLEDPADNVIDEVSYGNWADGNVSDNAPQTNDPNSIARKVNGRDTNNNKNDFSVTMSVTKGASNIISQSADEVDQDLPLGDYSDQIIINEIMPNPEGNDIDGEFIELLNIGVGLVDLSGWILGDNSTKRYVIETATINPGGFFVVSRSISKIALNNSGVESVNLYWLDSTLIDNREYASASEGESYSRDESGDWSWTSEVTPGDANIIEHKNQSPIALITVEPDSVSIGDEIDFDGSESYDPDGDKLEFIWDFGDGTTSTEPLVTHWYEKAGTYQIYLTVLDRVGASDTAEQIIYVGLEDFDSDSEFQQILITEILPNPAGLDAEGEFVEVFNPNGWDIDLIGWHLDDIDGGSRPYQIEHTMIKAGQYQVFARSETNLALNNDTDSVRLFDATGQNIDQVDYLGVKEGFSYALDQWGGWSWTSALTPGDDNVFVGAGSESSATGATSGIFTIDLSDIRDLEKEV